MSGGIEALKPFFAEHLKKRGVEISSFQGTPIIRCPFHEEQTGSFTVYKDHGHCFGCGWHGDIIDLEAEMTGRCRRRDFVAIVEDLSSFYGVCHGLERGFKPKRKSRIAPKKREGLGANVESESKAKLLLGKVLDEYQDSAWRFHLMDGSPQVLDNPLEEWRWLLQILFSPEDLIWVGGRYDSRHDNFQLLKDIVRLERVNEPLKRERDCFALGRFRLGAQGRRTEYLLGCDYILIECDELIGKKAESPEERELNKLQNASIIQWLSSYEDMTLRAVYDTGGKSLHSIWDKPSERVLKLLKDYCSPLGIDGQPLYAFLKAYMKKLVNQQSFYT